jgi:hypothetical protein
MAQRVGCRLPEETVTGYSAHHGIYSHDDRPEASVSRYTLALR